MTDRLFVDIHVIETLPPSCVNRDDLGSPKMAYYGGVTRARVSSQAWKRAIRTEFTEMQEEIGKRTKHVFNLVLEEIKKKAPDAEKMEELASSVIEAAGLTFDGEKKQDIKVLLFISPAQVAALAEVALRYAGEKKPDKKRMQADCEAALRSKPSLDVALFGRMVAEAPSLNYDAAAQVAHAISTHEVHNEFDYFTAVDDFGGTIGADHLGTMEFNSSTMYRYATVNALELEKNLGRDTPHVVRAFTEAFIRSMPTGKQNSYANRVRPDAVYVTVRRDQPVNMAGAFEKPVQAGKDGYVQGSVDSLIRYAEETYEDYYERPCLSLVVGQGLETLGEKLPLNAMLEKLETYLTEALAGKEQK